MSEATAAKYAIAPNLWWFAMAHFAITVVVIVVCAVLERFGISIPSMGTSIGAFFASSWIAGDKIAATLTVWTSSQRHQLAFGYSVIASLLTVPLALIAILAGVFINEIPLAAFGEWFHMAVPFLLFGVVVALLLVHDRTNNTKPSGKT